MEQFNDLVKALEAGNYNAAPSSLSQGSALQQEDLSPVMENVTFEDKHLILQKKISFKDAKSTLIQFNRQLDYGTFGGSSQYEGGIGEEDTSSFVRTVVPMAYYSTVRRVTHAANMIQAFDGVKAEDRSSRDAAMKLAGDIEFECFSGGDLYSDAGEFNGNPNSIPELPGMRGLFSQVSEADSLSNTQDLMFAEYGSDQPIVLPVDGDLSQSIIEDAAVRSSMNHGHAEQLLLDPVSLSRYNKIAHAKERIILAGSAQSASGADLRSQWTSAGTISMEPSRFLAGKTRPARARSGSPAAPSISAAASGDATSNLNAGTYAYYVTACNERGESVKSNNVSQASTAGQRINVTINTVANAKYFNVYRSEDGGSAASAKFIGRVKNSGAATTVFNDKGNMNPGSITGMLFQADTVSGHQLAPFSQINLAIVDLSIPKAYYDFRCVAARQPRKNVLLRNINAQF